MKRDNLKVFILPYIFILIILLWIIYFNFFKPTHYETVKKDCIKILKDNYSELAKLSDQLITERPEKGVKYQEFYFGYTDLEDKEAVTIDIGSRGRMALGGQDWGLIYSPKDDYLDGKNIEIYDEYKITGDGNNIFIYEKIEDKWYFYYYDWDGLIDTSKIYNE